VISFVVSLVVCTVLVFLGYSGFTGFLEDSLRRGGQRHLQLQLHHPISVPMISGGSWTPRISCSSSSLMVISPSSSTWSPRAPRHRVHEIRKQDHRHRPSLRGTCLVNYLASSFPARYDATSEKIYTLSPEQGRCSRRSASRTTLDLYYFERCERAVRGITRITPTASARCCASMRGPPRHGAAERDRSRARHAEEEKATAAGIEPQTIPGGSQFYFGLVATQADQQKVISGADAAARAISRIRRLRTHSTASGRPTRRRGSDSSLASRSEGRTPAPCP